MIWIIQGVVKQVALTKYEIERLDIPVISAHFSIIINLRDGTNRLEIFHSRCSLQIEGCWLRFLIQETKPKANMKIKIEGFVFLVASFFLFVCNFSKKRALFKKNFLKKIKPLVLVLYF